MKALMLFAVICAAIGWSVGCSEAEPDAGTSELIPADWSGSEPEKTADRVVVTAAWDTLAAIGGQGDTTLVNPVRLEVGEQGIRIFDQGRHQVLAFDPRGEALWSAGHQGAGPGEFGDVRDLAIGPDNRTFVLDAANGRITVLDPAGNVETGFSVSAYTRASAVVPLPDDRIILITRDGPEPLITLDSLGQLIRRDSMPWQAALNLDAMATQGRVSSTTDGRWVYAFSFGPGWFAYDGLDPLKYAGRYVEPMPFPHVVRTGDGGVGTRIRLTDTKFAARDVDVDSTVIYVLYGGLTDERNSLIDRYDWSTGEYLDSFRLPAPAYRLRVMDGTLYVLFNDPYPELLILRPTPD